MLITSSSLHFTASKDGATVIRPVFFEFPSDAETFNLGYEFMWGPRILVAPVVYQGTNSVNVYLPTDVWYSLSDYKYGSVIEPGYSTVPAPTTSMIPVFVRGESWEPILFGLEPIEPIEPRAQSQNAVHWKTQRNRKKIVKKIFKFREILIEWAKFDLIKNSKKYFFLFLK